MTINWNESRSPGRGSGRQGARSEYMIAPATAGATAQKLQKLIEQLDRLGGVEALRTHAEQGTIAPPVCVAVMSEERAATLSRSAAGSLLIEPNVPLRA